ncbi:MAG: class I SAM-dependent methyltransferase [Myxococcales bacterium]
MSERPAQAWWESFFDESYLRLWGTFTPEQRSEQEAEALWSILGLREGSRLLDAPCGYGRLSVPLARRGALVLGVDQSAVLLAEAERRRGDLPPSALRLLRHDLRAPLTEDGFDAVINILSSLGYGSENDDRAILSTLARAIRPGGRVFIDTMHRDAIAAMLSRGSKPAHRFPDGTLMIEEPRLDAVAGRIDTVWHWAGPGGSGSKPASLRIYTVTELVRMLESVGLRFQAAFKGCSPEPFRAEGFDMGGRIGLLAQKE